MRALVALDGNAELLRRLLPDAERVEALAEDPTADQPDRDERHGQRQLTPLRDRHPTEEPAVDARQVELQPVVQDQQQ